MGDNVEYASRGLRRRGDSDKWQVVLSHKDPLTGETVPSYHTVEAYAEVDPDAKRAAVDKVGEAFDIDLDGMFAEADEPSLTLTFTVEQLRTMLAEAERREAADA